MNTNKIIIILISMLLFISIAYASGVPSYYLDVETTSDFNATHTGSGSGGSYAFALTSFPAGFDGSYEYGTYGLKVDNSVQAGGITSHSNYSQLSLATYSGSSVLSITGFESKLPFNYNDATITGFVVPSYTELYLQLRTTQTTNALVGVSTATNTKSFFFGGSVISTAVYTANDNDSVTAYTDLLNSYVVPRLQAQNDSLGFNQENLYPNHYDTNNAYDLLIDYSSGATSCLLTIDSIIYSCADNSNGTYSCNNVLIENTLGGTDISYSIDCDGVIGTEKILIYKAPFLSGGNFETTLSSDWNVSSGAGGVYEFTDLERYSFLDSTTRGASSGLKGFKATVNGTVLDYVDAFNGGFIGFAYRGSVTVKATKVSDSSVATVCAESYTGGYSSGTPLEYAVCTIPDYDCLIYFEMDNGELLDAVSYTSDVTRSGTVMTISTSDAVQNINSEIVFYADYVDGYSNPVLNATCELTIDGDVVTMDYNSTSELYEIGNTEDLTGIYAYSITCDKNTYVTRTDNNSVVWAIVSDYTDDWSVVCTSNCSVEIVEDSINISVTDSNLDVEYVITNENYGSGTPTVVMTVDNSTYASFYYIDGVYSGTLQFTDSQRVVTYSGTWTETFDNQSIAGSSDKNFTIKRALPVYQSLSFINDGVFLSTGNLTSYGVINKAQISAYSGLRIDLTESLLATINDYGQTNGLTLSFYAIADVNITAYIKDRYTDEVLASQVISPTGTRVNLDVNANSDGYIYLASDTATEVALGDLVVFERGYFSSQLKLLNKYGENLGVWVNSTADYIYNTSGIEPGVYGDSYFSGLDGAVIEFANVQKDTAKSYSFSIYGAKDTNATNSDLEVYICDKSLDLDLLVLTACIELDTIEFDENVTAKSIEISDSNLFNGTNYIVLINTNTDANSTNEEGFFLRVDLSIAGHSYSYDNYTLPVKELYIGEYQAYLTIGNEISGSGIYVDELQPFYISTSAIDNFNEIEYVLYNVYVDEVDANNLVYVKQTDFTNNSGVIDIEYLVVDGITILDEPSTNIYYNNTPLVVSVKLCNSGGCFEEQSETVYLHNQPYFSSDGKIVIVEEQRLINQAPHGTAYITTNNCEIVRSITIKVADTELADINDLNSTNTVATKTYLKDKDFVCYDNDFRLLYNLSDVYHFSSERTFTVFGIMDFLTTDKVSYSMYKAPIGQIDWTVKSINLMGIDDDNYYETNTSFSDNCSSKFLDVPFNDYNETATFITAVRDSDNYSYLIEASVVGGLESLWEDYNSTVGLIQEDINWWLTNSSYRTLYPYLTSTCYAKVNPDNLLKAEVLFTDIYSLDMTKYTDVHLIMQEITVDGNVTDADFVSYYPVSRDYINEAGTNRYIFLFNPTKADGSSLDTNSFYRVRAVIDDGSGIHGIAYTDLVVYTDDSLTVNYDVDEEIEFGDYDVFTYNSQTDTLTFKTLINVNNKYLDKASLRFSTDKSSNDVFESDKINQKLEINFDAVDLLYLSPYASISEVDILKIFRRDMALGGNPYKIVLGKDFVGTTLYNSLQVLDGVRSLLTSEDVRNYNTQVKPESQVKDISFFTENEDSYTATYSLETTDALDDVTESDDFIKNGNFHWIELTIQGLNTKSCAELLEDYPALESVDCKDYVSELITLGEDVDAIFPTMTINAFGKESEQVLYLVTNAKINSASDLTKLVNIEILVYTDNFTNPIRNSFILPITEASEADYFSLAKAYIMDFILNNWVLIMLGFTFMMFLGYMAYSFGFLFNNNNGGM